MEKTFRPEDANRITREYMDRILIEERLIDAVVPSLSTRIFGREYKTPIMMPAFSHLPVYNGRPQNGLVEYALGAKALGALNWIGMIENDGFDEVMAAGCDTVRIIKPYADREKVFNQIRHAEETGAVAVGIDPDHIFSNKGGYDLVEGESMTTQSFEDIRAMVRSTSLPFVIKGVLSVRDALKCADMGVKGIVVSHHHGRLPFALPPLMVLPAIREALGNNSGVEIFVDCGMDTGADVFKALALGADAVSVGRAMWPALIEKGQSGLEEYVTRMNDQLSMILAFTGCTVPADAEPSMLWLDGKPMK